MNGFVPEGKAKWTIKQQRELRLNQNRLWCNEWAEMVLTGGVIRGFVDRSVRKMFWSTDGIVVKTARTSRKDVHSAVRQRTNRADEGWEKGNFPNEFECCAGEAHGGVDRFLTRVLLETTEYNIRATRRRVEQDD